MAVKIENAVNLGDRMKYYESVYNTTLKTGMPVIIRLDGRAFHTFTKRFVKPFDKVFVETMCGTMLYLCRNIAHCVFGYTQSDEITLILLDYDTEESKPWLNYRTQKLCSLSAAMATAVFNRLYEKNVKALGEKDRYVLRDTGELELAMFDSRCFNITEEDVVNCLIWRQRDAQRNSVSAMAHKYLTKAEVYKCNTAELRKMIKEKTGLSWEDYPIGLQRGFCAVRKPVEIHTENGVAVRKKWLLDSDIPIFEENKAYITEIIMRSKLED